MHVLATHDKLQLNLTRVDLLLSEGPKLITNISYKHKYDLNGFYLMNMSIFELCSQIKSYM